MASKRETSVEPRVEEKATGWLSKYGIQYWLKSESMNSEIDNARWFGWKYTRYKMFHRL